MTRMKQLRAILKSMDVDIDDKAILDSLWNGLAPNYETLIVVLDTSGTDVACFFNELVSSTLQEKQRSGMKGQ